MKAIPQIVGELGDLPEQAFHGRGGNEGRGWVDGCCFGKRMNRPASLVIRSRGAGPRGRDTRVLPADSRRPSLTTSHLRAFPRACRFALPAALVLACSTAGSRGAEGAAATDSLATLASAYADTVITDSTARAAPDFMLADLDGVPRRFLGFSGRVVLLVYWSPECPECMHEMPRLARLYARDRARGLAVVGVTYPRLRSEAATYAREKALGFPVLLDEGGRVSRLYHITTTPTVVVVRNGRVVLTRAGYDPKATDPIERAVEALLR